jgi:hypothetical protein
MKLVECNPPRTFRVGPGAKIVLSDTGTVFLEVDEQVTFKTSAGTEFDVVRKNFGYYATPSVNKRLVDFNFRTVLVRHRTSRRAYVLLVERGWEETFYDYCKWDNLRVVCWLSDNESLDRIEKAFD